MATAFKERAWKAINEAAAAHGEDIASADPAIRYFELLRSALGSGVAHVATPEGEAPQNPGAWGWREREFRGRDGPETRWEPEGKCIGWLEGDDLYLDPDAAFAAAQAVAGIAGEGLTIRPRTLTKRLHEKGHLASTDLRRKRLLVRAKIEGEPRDGLLHVRVRSVYLADEDDSCGRKPDGRTVGEMESSTGEPAPQAGSPPVVDDLDNSIRGTPGPSANTSQSEDPASRGSSVGAGGGSPPTESSKSSTHDASGRGETGCDVDDSGGVDDPNVHGGDGNVHPQARGPAPHEMEPEEFKGKGPPVPTPLLAQSPPPDDDGREIAGSL